MRVEALTGKEGTALPLERDHELEVRLERELPQRLAVGRGNAVFVYGSCFHRRRTVERLRIVADGRSVPAMAHGMPRRDLFAKGLPYRSGFWAIVPFPARARRGTATIEVAAELDDRSEVVAELATLELVPRAATEPVPWRDGGTEQPLVAICMATYDPPMDLFRTQIESIRAQTHRNWVCVISDDNSRAESFAELEAALDGDARFAVSRSPRRLGFYSNFERAVSMAPAEAAYLSLADQDDRWAPDKLEVLVSALGDAQLAYSDARVVDVDGNVVSETYWSRRRTNHSNLASLLISNTITGAASLFRRELIDRLLPFPPELGRQWHDHWIALVALATGRVEYVDRPLYDYVQHHAAVVGHAAANEPRPRRTTAARLRLLRADWREAFAGWRWKYFYGVCRVLLLARVLELRCEESLGGPKLRAVRRLSAIDRSPLGYAWLSARRLRRLVGLNETLGGERLFLHGLAWRRILGALTWRRRRPPAKLLKDASLPPPGGATGDGSGIAGDR